MAKRKSRMPTNPKARGQSGKPLARAIGPAADEFGKAVAPLGERAGKLTMYVGGKLLGMLEQSVFGVERVAEWVRTEVSRRLKDVPEDKIAEPNPRIAVPAVQALTYSMGENHIREMFANLLAADMNLDVKENAHPAFVEIIKEMTPSDARLVGLLRRTPPQVEFRARSGSAAKFNELGTHYSFQIEQMTDAQIAMSVSNLQRLGLVNISRNEVPLRNEIDERENEIKKAYEPQMTQVEEIRKQLAETNPAALAHFPQAGKLLMAKSGIFLTPLGHMFEKVCLSQKD